MGMYDWDAKTEEVLEDHARAGSKVALGMLEYGPLTGAVSRTWDGGGADNNWGTVGNWSADTAPTASDEAVFNVTSAKDCTVEADKTITSFTVLVSYTGTMTFTGSVIVTGTGASATIQGGSYDLTAAGVLWIRPAVVGQIIALTASNTVTFNQIGTDSGNGSANVDLSGSLKARSVTKTGSPQWRLTGNPLTTGQIVVSVGTFNTGAATVTLQTIGATTPEINQTGGTLNLSGSMIVYSNTGTVKVLAATTFSSFTIDAGVTVTNTGASTGNNAVFTLNGTLASGILNWTLTISSQANPFLVGAAGNLTGTGIFLLSASSNFNLGSGNAMSLSITTFRFTGSSSSITMTSTAALTLSGSYSQTGGATDMASYLWDMNGGFTASNHSFQINTGTLRLGGTVSVSLTMTASSQGTLIFDSSADQTWAAALSIGYLTFSPPAAGPVVSVTDSIRVRSDVTISAEGSVAVSAGKFICHQGAFVNNGTYTGVISPCTGVVITTPADGAVLKKNRPTSVQWSDTGVDTPIAVDLDVSYDGGSTYESLAANQADSGSVTWKPNRLTRSGRVRAVGTSGGGETGSDTNNVAVSPNALGAIGERKAFSQAIGDDNSHGGI